MKQALLLSLLVYVLATGGSYVVFAKMRGATGGSDSGLANPSAVIQTEVPTSDPDSRIVVAPEAPKTEVCPLNGKMYTTPEKNAWALRRPLAVMIENHMDARPQSGLSSADVVYEAVVEGGITRLMSIFYCEVQAKDTTVAPVRSARQAFLDWASEYNFPLYAHVGGSNGADTDPRVRALEHISDYGWNLRTDLNQFSIGYPTFVRNYDRIAGKTDLATEHTMESSTERLWAIAEKRGYTNMTPATTVRGKSVPGTEWSTGFTPWLFKDDAPADARGTVSKISYEFWSGYKDFDVAWDYDRATNSYARSLAAQPHLDSNTGKQLYSKNVVVMQLKELVAIDIHKHNLLTTIGTGKATIFQDGKAIQATWSKKDRLSRTLFTDDKGKPVRFVHGQIWISVIPVTNTITY